jgi:hypothetical protein
MAGASIISLAPCTFIAIAACRAQCSHPLLNCVLRLHASLLFCMLIETCNAHRAFVWGQHTAGLQLRQGSRSAASALAALTAAAGLTGAVAWAGPARAAAAAESDEQPPGDQFVDLPTEKLSCNRNAAAPRTPVVLVSAGSFNPPTYMHLRMCEVAVQELAQVR